MSKVKKNLTWDKSILNWDKSILNYNLGSLVTFCFISIHRKHGYPGGSMNPLQVSSFRIPTVGTFRLGLCELIEGVIRNSK